MRGVFSLPTPWTIQVARISVPIWLLGVVGMAGYFWRTEKRFSKISREQKSFTPEQEQMFQECRKIVRVRRSVKGGICAALPYPVTTGMIHPCILLPQGKGESPEELRAVLTHELIHVKRYDMLVRRLIMLVLILHWFNPAAWWLHILFKKWVEYACDYDACGILGNPRGYFEVMVKLLYQANGKKIPDYLGLFESQQQISRRMKRMNRYRKIRKTYPWAAAGLVSLMVVASAGTVLAAGKGMVAGYEAVYNATVVEIEEEMGALPTYTEYTETGTAPNIQVEEDIGAVPTGRSRTVSIEWTVGNNVLRHTSSFQASAGDSIQIAFFLSPSNRTVKVGIITPSGSKRYVLGSGTVVNTFSLTTTGSYQVFVENTSGAAVEVNGSYTVN